MKNFYVKLFALVTTFLVVTSAQAQCTNVTLTMNDSWGDGWNGGSISFISQCDGTVYGPYSITGSTGTQVICFPDGDYDYNMVPGSYPGEITWSLDNGVSGTGNSGSVTNAFSVGGGCPPPTTDVTLTMNDSWGDGWNGGSISFTSQCDGTVYGPYSITGSTGTQVITFPDGDYDITMVPGSYPGEITWSLDIGVSGTGNSGTITNAFTLGAGCPGGGGGGGSGCDQTITLYDSFGDGWNGGAVTVLVNGTPVLSGITLASGGGPQDFTFAANDGDAISVTYAAGSWAGENYYEVTDGNGTTLVSNYYPNTSGTWNGTAGCPSPCDQTITLYDTFGDGWNGGTVTVSVNGSPVLSGITIASGGGPEVYTFPAFDGDAIQVTYSAGSWAGENYYNITDGNGTTLVSNYYPNTSGTWNGTAGCGGAPACTDNEVTIDVTAGTFPSEVSWEFLDETGAVVASGGASASQTICIPDGCYDFVMNDSFGDGWNGATYTVTYNGGTIGSGTLVDGATGTDTGIGVNSVCDVYGCTDPASVNYNPAATIDDGSCVYPPANDDCANATAFTLTCGSSYTDAGTTANANNVGNGPACTTTASTAGGVWYEFIGTGNDVTASLCGSAYDTKIFVYTGVCGAFTCEGGNDDACGVQSEVTIPTVQGTTYTILVAGFGTATGDYTLTVTDNGGFSAAPTSVTGTTTICPGASTSLTAVGGTIGGGATVEWFSGSCGGTAEGSGTTISVSPAATTTYYVRYSGPCNTTTCASVTVTVSPVAGPTVAGTTQLCNGDNTTLVATGAQGNPLEWYSDAGGTTLINSGATFVTPNLTNNTTYYVGETAATSVGQYDQTVQVINPNLTPSNLISFPATPTGATGTPTLVITVYGDIDGTGTNLEQWQVNDESSTAIGTAGGTGNFADQCGSAITSTVNLTAAQIDSWAANGSIDFTVLDPDGNISMTLCGGDYVQLQLTYDYLSGGATACPSLLTQVDIVVDQPSTAAASISGTGSACLGTTSTLSVQGGSLSGTSNWEWYEGSCGGTVVGTGNSITVTPGATTTYFVAATANGACAATTCASGTVTLPTPSAVLSGNNQTATCAVNQNGYIHLLTPAGDLVASINSNGQNLGNVTATSYIEGSPLLLENCNNPGNASMMTSVMDRHWVITTQNAPTGPVSVLLPFTDNEIASLNIEAFNNANPDDDINFISDVGCTKYSGPNEDNLFDNDCVTNGGSGNFEWHSQVSNGQVDAYIAGHPASNKYLTIDVNGFSEFWLHGSSTNAPLPVELTRFEANCTDNGSELSWTTASEFNASHFKIKRSMDGLEWNTIAYVEAAGNSQQMIDYSIEDNAIATNRTVYYLLEQYDIDGSKQDERFTSLNCEVDNDDLTMLVYPNPGNGEMTINFVAPEDYGISYITLQATNGSIMENVPVNIKSGQNNIILDCSSYAPGIYIINISNDQFRTKTTKYSKH